MTICKVHLKLECTKHYFLSVADNENNVNEGAKASLLICNSCSFIFTIKDTLLYVNYMFL